MATRPTQTKPTRATRTSQKKLSDLDLKLGGRIQNFFAQFDEEIVSLEELRDELAKELKGQSLAEVVRQMRAESNP